MGENVRANGGPQPPPLDGAGLRIAVVAARFNDHVTVRLLDGVRRGLASTGIDDEEVEELWVPGAFELPLAAKACGDSGRFDAVVCVGCVIRGDTAHFDFVAGQCAEGIQRVQLDTGVPTAFGVLTTEDLDQALVRSEGAGGHNVGEDAALVAIEMATLLARLRR